MRVYLISLGWLVAGSALGADWTAEVTAFCAQNQESCVELQELRPVRTRAGHYRFVVSEVQEGSAWVLLQRLVEGHDSPAVRSALVPAIGPLLRVRPGLVLSLFEQETDSAVRVRLVAEMKEAPAEFAQVLLPHALGDDDPRVRETAVAMVGYQPAGRQWTHQLETLLADVDPSVRAMSARSLGWIDAKGSFSALVMGLQDTDANVRLQTLSALRRLDDQRLRGLTSVQRLQQDADSRVASLARRVLLER